MFHPCEWNILFNCSKIFINTHFHLFFVIWDFLSSFPLPQKGVTGDVGSRGPDGKKGDMGHMGSMGPRGFPGQDGLPGQPGQPGYPGKPVSEPPPDHLLWADYRKKEKKNGLKETGSDFLPGLGELCLGVTGARLSVCVGYVTESGALRRSCKSAGIFSHRLSPFS